MTKKTSSVILTREHGAWAMFAMPVLLGFGVSHTLNGAAVLFAATALCFFLLRYPLMLAIKSRAPGMRLDALRWSAIFAALTGLSGASLLLTSHLWALIPIAALGLAFLTGYLLLAARRAEMSTAGEWIGIAGLALGAPGAYLASTGRLDSIALALYVVNLLYFGGAVSYIKFKVREQPHAATSESGLSAQVWAGRVTLGYHALVLFVGATLAAIYYVPALTAVAFLLPMCKVVAGIVTRPTHLSLPRLGVIELAVTLAFALTVLAAYR
jgi:hypothetical protein